MNSRDFCFWLQGLFEIGNVKELNKEQIHIIKKHLDMVFVHDIDPSFGSDNDKLDKTHNMPDYMNPKLTEEELDEKYGKGVRPRC